MAGRSRAARVARASLRRRIHGGRHVLVRFAPRGVSPECGCVGETQRCFLFLFLPPLPTSRVRVGGEYTYSARTLQKGGGWRWWEGFKKLARRLHESFLQCQIDGRRPEGVLLPYRGLKFLWRYLAPKLPELRAPRSRNCSSIAALVTRMGDRDPRGGRGDLGPSHVLFDALAHEEAALRRARR